MGNKVCIYELLDSKGCCFYIGSTANSVYSRLQGHLYNAKSDYPCNKQLVEHIIKHKYNISARIIDVQFCSSNDKKSIGVFRRKLELKWMKMYLSNNVKLLNIVIDSNLKKEMPLEFVGTVLSSSIH